MPFSGENEVEIGGRSWSGSLTNPIVTDERCGGCRSTGGRWPETIGSCDRSLTEGGRKIIWGVGRSADEWLRKLAELVVGTLTEIVAGAPGWPTNRSSKGRRSLADDDGNWLKKSMTEIAGKL